ncbi:hypothetical protein [Isoptericola luteus]|uniref:hypothetical protein n=1 Tax=Isoptericola luteus TaxID=2879484 RepID=UPI001CE0D5F2|nr:hypothetical protein [Isoptericola sp. NEAU-Y5]
MAGVLSALAGTLLGAAVWLVLARAGRSATSAAAPSRRSPTRARPWRRGHGGRAAGWSAGPAETGDDVRVAVAQVVALLRAGAPPAAAWSRALGVRVDGSGLPDPDELAPVVGGAEHARSVVAGARLARDVGAPLGGVLDAVSAALVAEAEARAEQEAALAGPRATARVLLWLPGLGALLGWALGADPLATATDGGAGTAAVATGLLLLAVGRWWTARLVSGARRAGEEPA